MSQTDPSPKYYLLSFILILFYIVRDNFENINKVTEFTTMSHVIKKYYDERANFNELKNKLCSKPQTGGANYYNKYRKYKTKYLELKHSMAL